MFGIFFSLNVHAIQARKDRENFGKMSGNKDCVLTLTRLSKS